MVGTGCKCFLNLGKGEEGEREATKEGGIGKGGGGVDSQICMSACVYIQTYIYVGPHMGHVHIQRYNYRSLGTDLPIHTHTHIHIRIH